MLKTWTLLRALGPVDLKSVVRDSLLIVVLVGSLLLALLIRYATPFMTLWLMDEFGIDLLPYYPLLMSLVLLMASAMAGTVVGFLLLDERDDRTLTALLTSPIPLSSYVAYRLGLPIVLALIITPFAVSIAGLITIPWWMLLLVALLASLSGAGTALVLASFADNKVTGLAVMKIFQGIQVLPMASFFLVPPWQWVAGIVPTYWPLAVYWRMIAGEPFWIYWLIGVAFNVVVILLLLRRYEKQLRP
jgi:fluoroquinolone transport system permease protein